MKLIYKKSRVKITFTLDLCEFYLIRVKKNDGITHQILALFSKEGAVATAGVLLNLMLLQGVYGDGEMT